MRQELNRCGTGRKTEHGATPWRFAGRRLGPVEVRWFLAGRQAGQEADEADIHRRASRPYDEWSTPGRAAASCGPPKACRTRGNKRRILRCGIRWLRYDSPRDSLRGFFPQGFSRGLPATKDPNRAHPEGAALQRAGQDSGLSHACPSSVGCVRRVEDLPPPLPARSVDRPQQQPPAGRRRSTRTCHGRSRPPPRRAERCCIPRRRSAGQGAGTDEAQCTVERFTAVARGPLALQAGRVRGAVG